MNDNYNMSSLKCIDCDGKIYLKKNYYATDEDNPIGKINASVWRCEKCGNIFYEISNTKVKCIKQKDEEIKFQIIKIKKEVITMSNIKDFAKTYEAKTTKNISELPEVNVNFEIKDDEFEIEEDGKSRTVQQKVIEINGEKFRVPSSVFQQLKVLLEDNPSLSRFKVRKTGEGMNTRYTVIPLM